MMMPGIFKNDLFDDWMDFPFEKLLLNHEKNMMKTDIQEIDNGYEMDIDLPGFKKEDIHAQLTNGYLTISASKNLDKEEKDNNGRYIRHERYGGSMSRSFYVGDGVKETDIHAKFEDGILKLTIPKMDKKEIEQNNYIAIEG